jgi:putative membrane protein
MNADLTSAALLLADFDGHMDGGWWVVMATGMVLFWGLVIVGLVWLARELAGRGGGLRPRQDPLELLDRRLAEGTISPEDYHERREILGGSAPRKDDTQPG